MYEDDLTLRSSTKRSRGGSGRMQARLGRRFTFGRFPEKPEDWVEIVGVVRHIRHHRLDANVREEVYYPHARVSFSEMTLAIRTASDPLSVVGAVRETVRSLDPISRFTAFARWRN